MASNNRRNIQIIIFIAIIVVAIFSTVYLLSRQTNNTSNASAVKLLLKDYKPDLIEEGTTTSMLVNGRGFSSSCKFYLGQEELKINFMNDQSVELELPTDIKSTVLKAVCGDEQDLMQIQVKPKMDSLP